MRPAILLLVALSGCAHFGKRDPVTLDGVYRIRADYDYTLRFENGKCFAPDQDQKVVEAGCFMRGSLLYLHPAVPEGVKLSRDPWVVYEVDGDELRGSHLEDLDDGEVFYAHSDNKPVLVKVR
jgi:hypothetical protein